MIDPRAEAVRILRDAEADADMIEDKLEIVDRYIALGTAYIEEPIDAPEEPKAKPEGIKIEINPDPTISFDEMGRRAAAAIANALKNRP